MPIRGFYLASGQYIIAEDTGEGLNEPCMLRQMPTQQGVAVGLQPILMYSNKKQCVGFNVNHVLFEFEVDPALIDQYDRTCKEMAASRAGLVTAAPQTPSLITQGG